MRSGKIVARWMAVGVACAWLVAGCTPKTDETKGTASDSTVKAAATMPDSTAKDTLKSAAVAAPTGDPAKLGTLPVKPKTPPPHVQVQHILIGFQGTIPGKTITRTKDEAEKLAKDVLERARKGEDFDALVTKYTDDQYPGIYGLSNNGVKPDAAAHEFGRGQMVSGFGDIAFGLSVGNIDVATYQPDKTKPGLSPFGWHIIKRLK